MAGAPPGLAYLQPEYALTLRHDGTAAQLPRSGAWLNVDQIEPGLVDARHLYPGLFCVDWSSLMTELETIAGLVSAVAMVFPIGVRRHDLEQMFPFVCQVSTQYVFDPGQPLSKHHRAEVRKAKLKTSLADGAQAGDELVELYGRLRARHAITGTEDWPEESLRAQAVLPGARVFRATAHGRPAGLQVWLSGGGWAHYAISCYSDEGYAGGASYALMAHALTFFAASGHRIDLGRTPPGARGLAWFKLGWGCEEKPVYLCGRVFDQPAYERLVAERGASDWWPAYRSSSP